MRKQDAMRSQGHTCVLRVDNIHCDGCKGKIRKLLKKIDGVHAISIDMEQGKVAVTGNVDPAMLIRKLEKLGKHAEIWRNSYNSMNKNTQFDALNNQFKSLQMGSVKGGGGDKKHQPLGQEMKGFKELKAPFKMKDQKTVKFDLARKDHGGFDEFSDGDEDDEFGDFDEEFDEEFGLGGRQHGQKAVNVDRTKAAGKEKKGVKKGKKGGGGGFMSLIGKAIGGKSKGKKCEYGGKSKGKGGGGTPKYGGGEGKVGNKGGGGYTIDMGKKGGGGGKSGKFSDFELSNHHTKGGGGMGPVRIPGPRAPQMMNMNGGGGRGGGGNGYYAGGGVGPMTSQVGPLASAANPYQQHQQQHQHQQQQHQHQQQYMAMMMNQQRMMNVGGGGADMMNQHGNGMMNQQRMMTNVGGGDMMYHPAMYGRPSSGYGYAPPMMPPSPPRVYQQEPYTHMFSDENTDSCSIM